MYTLRYTVEKDQIVFSLITANEYNELILKMFHDSQTAMTCENSLYYHYYGHVPPARATWTALLL